MAFDMYSIQVNIARSSIAMKSSVCHSPIRIQQLDEVALASFLSPLTSLIVTSNNLIA